MQHVLSVPDAAWRGVLRPSRYYAAWLLGIHLGSVVVVYGLEIGQMFQWLLGALIVASGIYCVRRYAISVGQEITLSQQAGITFVKPNGVRRSGQLVQGGYNSPWVVVLATRMEESYRKMYIVIFRDALDCGAFRRLRVYLKFVR